jgi:uncharacterized MAPEG superfamily protein
MGMSFELMVLAAASLWGFLQLVGAAQAASAQHGLKSAASPRDTEMPPLTPLPGRINRNFRNYMETFPFFAAAVLTAQATGVHNELPHWESIAYIGGSRLHHTLYIRYSARPLAVLEHRRLWHARGLVGAFRAALKYQTASASDLVCVGTCAPRPNNEHNQPLKITRF